MDPRVDSVRKALSNAKAFQQALSLMKSMSRTPRHEEQERVEAVAVEAVSPIAARIRKSLSVEFLRSPKAPKAPKSRSWRAPRCVVKRTKGKLQVLEAIEVSEHIFQDASD